VLAAGLASAASAQAQPFVYVVEANGVSQFDAMGGALSPLSPATVACACGPFGIAVSPDGKSMYVTQFLNPPSLGKVSQFDVGAGAR
jgi:DNA-binding beta-propeller fold protein YncE